MLLLEFRFWYHPTFYRWHYPTDYQRVQKLTKHRVALGVEYNGSSYHGWQRQKGLDTVQGYVEKAITKIADEPIGVVCSGRTDTGVHATSQVIHFDTHAQRDWQAWVYGTNTHLPADIGIRWAKKCSQDFHARFKATRRHYRYFLYNAESRCAVLSGNIAWHYHHLDEQKMHQAAQDLVGRHDFTAYRAVGCQAKSPIRELYTIRVQRQESMIIFDFEGSGFLHHMVRNIVGVLMAIGAGKASIGWAKSVLETRDRKQAGITAPAAGLYFVNAIYPDVFAIPIAAVPTMIF